MADAIAALIFSTQVTATGRPVPFVVSYNATKFLAVALLLVLCIKEQPVEVVPKAYTVIPKSNALLFTMVPELLAIVSVG